MMPDGDEARARPREVVMDGEGCRKQARQYAALAATTIHSDRKNTLTRMAENWMKLALDVERGEALVDQPPPAHPGS